MINTECFFMDIYKNARENSDQKGTILQVTQSFLTAFGYKRNDVIGKHFRVQLSITSKLMESKEKEKQVLIVITSKNV